MMATNQASFSGKTIAPPPVPVDFGETFVALGRLECETRYRAPRHVIDAWMRQVGKKHLIAKRAAFVRERLEQQRLTEKLREMAKVFERSFPVEDPRIVSHELAAAAAQHLRIGRNGGFLVSPTGAGDWWVGLKRRSSADLLDMAVARGFDAVTLTGGCGGDVGSRP